MSPEKITYMANQIAKAFAALPPETAQRSTAEHINDFWEPRMRAELFALLGQPQNGLSEIVVAAAPQIRPVS